MIDPETQAFYNVDTGELYYYSNAWSDLGEEDEDDVDVEGESWIALPDSLDVEDLQWMRKFARRQPSPVGDTLLDAAYARHPYRAFKDAAAQAGVLDEWFAYRDERLRDVALWWFESNGLTPGATEGASPNANSLPPNEEA